MRVEGPKGQQVQTRVASGPQMGRIDVGVQEVTSLTKGVTDLALGLKNRADEAAAEEALVAFEREKNSLFMDPNKGYFAKSGRDAYDGAEDTKAALDKIRQTYADSLGSPMARDLFDNAAKAHVTRGWSDIDAHAMKGLRIWEVANVKSEMENSLANATLYWNQTDMPSTRDPNIRIDRLNEGLVKVIGDPAKDIEGALDRAAKLEGDSSPETLIRRKLEYQSQYYAAAVQGALRSSHEDGQKLFEKYGDLITGADRLRVMDALAGRASAEKDASIAAQSVGAAQSIFSMYKDRKEGLAAAMAIEDKAVSGRATKELMYLYTQSERAEQEAQVDAYDAAEEYLRTPGATVDQFIKANPERWATMRPEQKALVESRANVKTDWIRYFDVKAMDAERLAQVDMGELPSYLAPTERKEIGALVKAARDGTRNPRLQIEGQAGRTVAAQTKAAARQVFGDPKTWNGEKAKKVNQFYELVNRMAAQAAAPNGTVDDTAYETILKRATSSVYKKGYIMDSEYTLADVPADDQAAITQRLQLEGKAVTPENILKVYIQANK